MMYDVAQSLNKSATTLCLATYTFQYAHKYNRDLRYAACMAATEIYSSALTSGLIKVNMYRTSKYW